MRSREAATERRDGTGPVGPARRWLILPLLSLAGFMVILDVTVVNVALPQIGRSLGLDREALTWVVTAYTVTFGGLQILGGRLADALGRKLVFLSGLTLFTGASMTAGLATGAGMLLASRGAQGVGAALLSPSALSIITTEFTGKDRNRALGVWAAIGAAGAAVGVLVGGALTSGPGWEWVFYINVPVGLLVGLTVPAVVPTRPHQAGTGVDIPGALTGTAAVTLLIYGLIRTGDTGWTSASALAPMGVAVVLGAGFVLIERRAAAPLFPLRLVTRPPLPGAVAMMTVGTGVLLAAFFLTSIYLQHAERYSPLRTGLSFLPVALGTAVGAHLAARGVTTLGPRPIGSAGMTLAAAGLAVMAWQGVGGAVPTELMPGFVLAAVGLGAALVTATTSGLSAVEHEHAGVASGILNTGHEVGGSLSIAVVSAIAAVSISAGPHATLTGFQHSYLAAAIGAAALAVAAQVLLPPGRLDLGDRPMFAH